MTTELQNEVKRMVEQIEREVAVYSRAAVVGRALHKLRSAEWYLQSSRDQMAEALELVCDYAYRD